MSGVLKPQIIEPTPLHESIERSVHHLPKEGRRIRVFLTDALRPLAEIIDIQALDLAVFRIGLLILAGVQARESLLIYHASAFEGRRVQCLKVVLPFILEERTVGLERYGAANVAAVFGLEFVEARRDHRHAQRAAENASELPSRDHVVCGP